MMKLQTSEAKGFVVLKMKNAVISGHQPIVTIPVVILNGLMKRKMCLKVAAALQTQLQWAQLASAVVWIFT